MPRRTHYSPCINRVVICALYHEGRRLRRPMTRLVNDLLTSCMRDTEAWSIAAKQLSDPAQGTEQEAGATR
ncbi:MAG: hypothetical protein K9N47_07680 [Prosthecobacter sp.]|uniref:hypothetical protein n=1 Tax=Prosthecobacter sp. TaxID=1965333 RepID=UPI0025FD17A9|nr:hypothetical protein [Prosthecobacter sp.]MCF7785985.1 hypothetical protein [Prosthecobacter sp.]